MMIDQLEAAVLSKQSSAVVHELSSWTEDQRAAARYPFAIFMLAHGMEGNFVRLLDSAASADSVDVKEKRKKDNIKPTEKRRGSDYDYQLQYIAWLAAYGLGDQGFCNFFPRAPDYDAESAQIMADRRPSWLDQWLVEGTQYFEDEDEHRANHRYEFDPWFWAQMFHLGLVKVDSVDQRWIANHFMRALPACMENAEEATKYTLENLTSHHDAVYNLPQWQFELHRAKDWVPVLTWMAQQKYIDHRKYAECLIAALHQPLNQTERNGCVLLAKAITGPEAKCPPQVLVKLQDHWRGLLGDSQASVAGFALDQLLALEKKGKLDYSSAVAQLPSIFQHKPKTHAVKAVKLLARACQASDARFEALEGLCVALTHSNKDVQAVALESLEDEIKHESTQSVQSLKGWEALYSNMVILGENNILVTSKSPMIHYVMGLNRLQEKSEDIEKMNNELKAKQHGK